MHPDIEELDDQLEAAELAALALVTDLNEQAAAWRSEPGAWSVAECLDHLATANRVYLHAMKGPATRARTRRRLRRGPALPGVVGRLFIRTLEPPVKSWFRGKAPRSIRPRNAPTLADAFAAFLASQDQVRAFLRAHADLDLAGTRFPNPFLPGVRFSLATGLHVIAAHERRHLWQATRVREMAEQASAGRPGDGRSKPSSAT
jgi:hypothetical protein